MSNLRVTVVPVGRMDVAELEAALSRVAKVIHRPLELRESATLPRGSEDAARGQHRAPELLAGLRVGTAPLGVRKLVGATVEGAGVPTPAPDATVFVTDVDLFTATHEGAFTFLDGAKRAGVLSVRRLREPFYRRRADPKKQRSRMIKGILYVIGRLLGLPECPDAACVLAPAQVVVDIDRKGERFCPACWRRISSGVIRI